jgi:hypothetical protein
MMRGLFLTLALFAHPGGTAPAWPAVCPPPLPSAETATVLSRRAPWFWVVIDFARSLSYTCVPKVMCSSIRRIMNANAGPCRARNRCAEVRRNHRLQQVNLTAVTRFVVMRDPFDRLVSAYYNSATNRFIFVGRCKTPKDCTFAEFVAALALEKRKRGNLNFNEHFMLQVDIAQFHSMHYHYILRMSCAKHLECIYKGLLNTTQVHANKSARPTSEQAASKESMFTPDVLRTVLELYQRDLDMWKLTECTGPSCECTPTTADRILT